MTEEIRYRDYLGRAMVIKEVDCLCSHAAHAGEKCPHPCGCLRYRPVTRAKEYPDDAA